MLLEIDNSELVDLLLLSFAEVYNTNYPHQYLSRQDYEHTYTLHKRYLLVDLIVLDLVVAMEEAPLMDLIHLGLNKKFWMRV